MLGTAAMKASVTLEIDELGLEARVTVSPNAEGAEVSPDSVKALLAEKGIKEGIDTEAIERAFRTLSRKREPVSFAAARGRPPQPAEAESVQFETFPLPPALAARAQKALAAAGPPELFILKEEKVKSERKVLKKAALPFLPAKEEIEVVWEKKTTREKLAADPAFTPGGYVRAESLVARVKPGTQGKEGRSIFGRLVPAGRQEKRDFHFGTGLKRTGADVRAEYSGFLRTGAAWSDLVPYRDNELSLFAEGATCLLSFSPGDEGAAPPDIAGVLAEAEKLGFKKEALLPEAEIRELLRQAAASRTPVDKRPITPSEDAAVSVAVSPDRLRATLSIRKGRGLGRKLSLAEVSEAIRRSGVKGFNADIVKKDILAFYNGTHLSVSDYTLAVGQPPEKGEDGKLEWLVTFLKKEETERIRQASSAAAARITDTPSLAAFPLTAVEAVARVESGAEVLRVVPPGAGKPGIDVFKTGIAGLKGAEKPVTLYEGVKKQKDIITAALPGILEKGTKDGVVLLRVRPHKDAELQVDISDDRMRAAVGYYPAEGTGKGISPEEVKARLEQAGVIQGVKSDSLLEALGAITRNTPFKDFTVAEGKPPRGGSGRTIAFRVAVAAGAPVAVREDGSADFKNITTFTQVHAGEHLATLEPGQSAPEDGWDVTGRAIPAGTDTGPAWTAGKNVRAVEEPGGRVQFYAEKDGELSTEKNTLEVKELHAVPGNVDLTTGNVKFMGKVSVKGSVLSGFTILAGDDVSVGEVVQAAFVSSEGSITIGQGVKGEGRAVLRARKDIRASFAEQAILISLGDVRLKSGCLRCQVKCNGTFTLESDKGNLMGGSVRARNGASVQNLGSAGGARTELSFGQDYVMKDQIEKEEREAEALKRRIAELDLDMRRQEKAGAAGRQALEAARAEKLQRLKELERRSLRLLGLRDKFEEHFPSEVVVRGTLFPGAVVESHGRLFEVRTEKSKLTLYFDPSQGRILEKPAKAEAPARSRGHETAGGHAGKPAAKPAPKPAAKPPGPA
jgi:uncharacterized protein